MNSTKTPLFISKVATDGQPDASFHRESAAREVSPAGYKPRSWRYPMDLFRALLPLAEPSFSASDLLQEDARFGPTYGNRLAWARRFPGFGSSRPAGGDRTCQA